MKTTQAQWKPVLIDWNRKWNKKHAKCQRWKRLRAWLRWSPLCRRRTLRREHVRLEQEASVLLKRLEEHKKNA